MNPKSSSMEILISVFALIISVIIMVVLLSKLKEKNRQFDEVQEEVENDRQLFQKSESVFREEKEDMQKGHKNELSKAQDRINELEKTYARRYLLIMK